MHTYNWHIHCQTLQILPDILMKIYTQTKRSCVGGHAFRDVASGGWRGSAQALKVWTQIICHKLWTSVANRCVLSRKKCTKAFWPDPTGEAWDTLPDSLVGWGGDTLTTHPFPLNAVGIFISALASWPHTKFLVMPLQRVAEQRQFSGNGVCIPLQHLWDEQG